MGIALSLNLRGAKLGGPVGIMVNRVGKRPKDGKVGLGIMTKRWGWQDGDYDESAEWPDGYHGKGVGLARRGLW